MWSEPICMNPKNDTNEIVVSFVRRVMYNLATFLKWFNSTIYSYKLLIFCLCVASNLQHLWNWTPDAHPIHLHLVSFQVLGRFDIFKFEKYNGNNPLTTGLKPTMGYLPYEYMKDTVIAYSSMVTQLWVTFDRPDLYVLHCHILSHEDNEMMLPNCIGEPGVDCPAEFFVGSNSTCTQ